MTRNLLSLVAILLPLRAAAFAPATASIPHATLRHQGASRSSMVVGQLFTKSTKEKAASGGKGLTGLVKPTKIASEAENDELSLKELLTEYGVIALLFHFTVWITSLLTVYTLLSVGVDFDSLPDWLSFLETESADADGFGAAAGYGARIASTLGVVEAIGPARLALTVTATPKVSAKAREYAVVRDLEEWAEKMWYKFAGQ